VDFAATRGNRTRNGAQYSSQPVAVIWGPNTRQHPPHHVIDIIEELALPSIMATNCRCMALFTRNIAHFLTAHFLTSWAILYKPHLNVTCKQLYINKGPAFFLKKKNKKSHRKLIHKFFFLNV